jgi:hypothetical protein
LIQPDPFNWECGRDQQRIVYEEGAKKREREREREIRPGQEELLEEALPCGNAKRGQEAEEEEEAEVRRSKPRVWPSPCGSDASQTLLTTEEAASRPNSQSLSSSSLSSSSSFAQNSPDQI